MTREILIHLNVELDDDDPRDVDGVTDDVLSAIFTNADLPVVSVPLAEEV